MQSNWPDHTPEPGESPPWLGWGAAAAVVAALLIWSPDAGNWRPSFHLPDIRMPEFSLPEFRLPDFTRNQSLASESAAVSEMLSAAGGPIAQQQVPFDTCVSMRDEAANAFGQQALFSVESTDDRQIAVLKFPEGDLTITCSRADETMIVERRGS